MGRHLVFGCCCSCWHGLEAKPPLIMDPRRLKLEKRGLIDVIGTKSNAIEKIIETRKCLFNYDNSGPLVQESKLI